MWSETLPLVLRTLYSTRSARRLPADKVGMIVDKGHDFPPVIRTSLERYGSEMWMFREQACGTTRALNSYRGDLRKYVFHPLHHGGLLCDATMDLR